jgi:hypothetical protein
MASVGGAISGPPAVVQMVATRLWDVNARTGAREAEIWGFLTHRWREMQQPRPNDRRRDIHTRVGGLKDTPRPGHA